MTSIYSPDSWEIIEVKSKDSPKLHHRVLAGWSGSYMYGNNWKVSSGFISVFDLGDLWKVPQTSGSVYMLNKHREHPSVATCGILEVLQENSPDVTIGVVSMDSILQSYGIF